MIEHKDNHDGIFANTKALSLDEGYGTLPVGSEAVMAPPSKSTDAAVYFDLLIFGLMSVQTAVEQIHNLLHLPLN